MSISALYQDKKMNDTIDLSQDIISIVILCLKIMIKQDHNKGNSNGFRNIREYRR